MALATDFDGTIAHDGFVPDDTIAALERFKESGRKLIMVTGRELRDLERVCPRLDLFDIVIIENGAVIYRPKTKQMRPLGPPPPPEFVARLEAMAVDPLSVGEVIVATWEPNQGRVLDAIRELGLDLQIIFNKGAVMVLPSGLNKASGLKAGLDELGLSAHNIIATGDAENDLAFMRACGCAVAVFNALPGVKAEADFVTTQPRGAGVAEAIDLALEDETQLLHAARARHGLMVGTDQTGALFQIEPTAGQVLIAGQSGSGKSTLANALLERMVEGGFQFCIFDPEGDYSELDSAVNFGDAKTPVRAEPVLAALGTPSTNVVVNMLGLDVADRPALFAKLYAAIFGRRSATARPHWLLVDEAHHMLPARRDTNAVAVGTRGPPTIFVTVHPEALSADVVDRLDVVLAIGPSAHDVVTSVARTLGLSPPTLPDRAPDRGEALAWCRADGGAARIVAIRAAEPLQKRHTRKYAEGSLGEDKSFYFRGPEGALKLRAQNLMMFLQLADGVDPDTFMHHLRQGDYSGWLRTAIKDADLADEIALVEAREDVTLDEARAALRSAVELRYTAPSTD